MATTNLFGHPAFKDGAFTSNDRGVRRAAIGKAMRAIDLGGRLGAEVFVFWGGREGTEVGTAKDPRDALERYREAIDVLVDYSLAQGHEMRFAIEPKPNEPRGDIFLPTVGHALHFITMLARPDMVRREPRGGARDDGRAVVPPRRRPGAVGGQALPHRPQRPADRPLRPGLPLRRGGPQGGLPPRAAARARGLRRAAALRRARLPHRGRRGRVGVRARVHGDLPRARGARRSASTPTPTCARRWRRRRWRSWASRPSAATTPRRSRRRSAGSTRSRARGYGNERLDQLAVEVLLGVR